MPFGLIKKEQICRLWIQEAKGYPYRGIAMSNCMKKKSLRLDLIEFVVYTWYVY